MGPLEIVFAVIGVLLVGILCFFAIRSGESRKKEMLLEAKDEIHRSRTEHEKEVKERRSELSKQERRLQQKEESLDKKADAFERKESELASRLADVAQTREQVEKIKAQHLEKLEEISGLTQEQAKQFLLDSVESEVRHETAMKIKEIEQQLKDEADNKAREILSTAIQRCAADHVAEATVSVVPLPNDEMKGRIIGRDGRQTRRPQPAPERQSPSWAPHLRGGLRWR